MKLQRLLGGTGCIGKIDAIEIQTEIAATIIVGGGNHLRSIKENQGYLLENFQFYLQWMLIKILNMLNTICKKGLNL